ncbi:ATPase [Nocardia sp. NPDC051030]|uniref:ATPase n=1 Tax=Nocardia sp. NPDC051030 TaxID=3155162 RepID=UPI003418DB9B
MSVRSEVLLLGGRSGVGKSSVGYEVHARLSATGIRHCLIEGDFLDMAFPPPWEHGLAEQNLAAMWANYRALDYHRLIYTNTVSVLDPVIASLTAAMGERPRASAILLRCSDESARHRLGRREIGSELEHHLDRSRAMAERLDRDAPSWVRRIDTDARSVTDIATDVIDHIGWSHNP